MEAKPLIVIVGPTASGKTALAVELAEKFGGEIICADSRTIYRGMDIGTAKPTKSEQEVVRHWGVDIVNPDQRYTAADFKKYAVQKIAEIRSRGNVPFLVGGSGLYVDAIIFDYQFGNPADEKLRSKFEKLTVEELHYYCANNNIALPQNYNNKRYVIRAIEQNKINKKRKSAPINNTYIVGITTESYSLRKKIEQRADVLFENGVVQEAKELGDKYGWSHEAMTGNIYPLCHEYIENKLSIDDVKRKFIVQDWRLAKRQLTWFRRNQFINWLDLSDAKEYIISLLASEH